MFHTQDEQGNGRPALDFPSLHINLQYDSNWTRPMKRKNFGAMQCPIARGLERVGEWWSILILRDAFAGMSRFDEFQKSLGIAPNMLTRRLTALVEAGLLQRHRYSERPPRDEYRLTGRGHDFRPVLLAMLAWGTRNFAPEGPSVQIVDAETGVEADPVLVDRATGRPLIGPHYVLVPGPSAGDATRQRLNSGTRGSLLPGSPA
jgi:DNA-binding HxlR family transcriptional regulator